MYFCVFLGNNGPFMHKKQKKSSFLKNNCSIIWSFQKKSVPLHSQLRNIADVKGNIKIKEMENWGMV